MNDEKEVDKSVTLMYNCTYDQARKIMSEFSTDGRVSAGASALGQSQHHVVLQGIRNIKIAMQ